MQLKGIVEGDLNNWFNSIPIYLVVVITGHTW